MCASDAWLVYHPINQHQQQQHQHFACLWLRLLPYCSKSIYEQPMFMILMWNVMWIYASDRIVGTMYVRVRCECMPYERILFHDAFIQFVNFRYCWHIKWLPTICLFPINLPISFVIFTRPACMYSAAVVFHLLILRFSNVDDSFVPSQINELRTLSTASFYSHTCEADHMSTST